VGEIEEEVDGLETGPAQLRDEGKVETGDEDNAE